MLSVSECFHGVEVINHVTANKQIRYQESRKSAKIDSRPFYYSQS